MDDKIRKLVSSTVGVLESNMIHYELNNDGRHLRAYDEDHGDWWNIYFPSTKFHKDRQPTSGIGIRKFLDKFNLIMVDKNMIGVQLLYQDSEAEKISDHQLYFYPSANTEDSEFVDVIVIPFNIDFSLVPTNANDRFFLKKLGDGWMVNTNAPFIITSSSKIFISNEAGVNWDSSKEFMDEKSEIFNEEL